MKDVGGRDKGTEISVIIPVYNVEKYLKRCIDSILVQEWKHYDILLVDDGQPAVADI